MRPLPHNRVYRASTRHPGGPQLRECAVSAFKGRSIHPRGMPPSALRCIRSRNLRHAHVTPSAVFQAELIVTDSPLNTTDPSLVDNDVTAKTRVCCLQVEETPPRRMPRFARLFPRKETRFAAPTGRVVSNVWATVKNFFHIRRFFRCGCQPLRPHRYPRRQSAPYQCRSSAHRRARVPGWPGPDRWCSPQYRPSRCWPP